MAHKDKQETHFQIPKDLFAAFKQWCKDNRLSMTREIIVFMEGRVSGTEQKKSK